MGEHEDRRTGGIVLTADPTTLSLKDKVARLERRTAILEKLVWKLLEYMPEPEFDAVQAELNPQS